MRATYGTVSSRHTRLVFLGAVLMGCVFSLPGHALAAGLTVEIIKPTALPSFTFDTGTEYDFEAVSFAEGQELAGGEVTWEWDFGDGTAHVLTNPCKHTFANPGNWVVTVTARYGALDGQDTLNAAAFPEGVAESVVVVPASGSVCDWVHIACRCPAFQFLGFSLREVQFSRLVGDQWLPVSSQTPVNQVQIGNLRLPVRIPGALADAIYGRCWWRHSERDFLPPLTRPARVPTFSLQGCWQSPVTRLPSRAPPL